jgi:RNA polymerase sigma-70 factor (ECF subfamily)
MKPNGPSQSHLDDANLISSGLQGDRDAFNVLFTRYRQLLYCLAYRVLRNHEESEDAVQNCSLLAYCKLAAFKHEWAFRSWLARILVNEAVSILRQRKSRLRSSTEQLSSPEHEEAVERLPARGPNPEQALMNKQSAIALAKKVSQLCASQRSALLLRDLWEFSTEETSALLKVTPNAVRAKLFRARKQLAAAMLLDESSDQVA